jgi:hypothetical protein
MAQDPVQWRILRREFSFIIFELLTAVSILLMMGIEVTPETWAIFNQLIELRVRDYLDCGILGFDVVYSDTYTTYLQDYTVSHVTRL